MLFPESQQTSIIIKFKSMSDEMSTWINGKSNVMNMFKKHRQYLGLS